MNPASAPVVLVHDTTVRWIVLTILAIDLLALIFVLFGQFLGEGQPPMVSDKSLLARWAHFARRFLLYQLLLGGAVMMGMPFYWMIATSFKDGETAIAFPPRWLPVRARYEAPLKPGDKPVEVRPTSIRRKEGELVTVVPVDKIEFKEDSSAGYSVHKESWDKKVEAKVPLEAFEVTLTQPASGAAGKSETKVVVEGVPPKVGASMNGKPGTVSKVELKTPGLHQSEIMRLDLQNFRKAWYAPEGSTRGQANFARYFFVSVVSALLATCGTLITGALAAFAFARFDFIGKSIAFYLVLATMMVPGQVLLIPNFLILGKFGWLDTFAALIVPWLASVFTIFLMRQFFLTIPNDLWEAARIDGASHFRFLWQIVMPLSKPVFITAGIFNFLNNWNSLLWPLIVTSQPRMRTLMVGLQSFIEDAGTDFHLLMAASAMAIVPVVILFFVLQRFFIEGIARTGLK